MKKQIFAALAFAGVLTAWSITAKANITFDEGTAMDFVLKNQTRQVFAFVYVHPKGSPRGANRLGLGFLSHGQSKKLQFSCSTSPNADYELEIEYYGSQKSFKFDFDFSKLEEISLFDDDAGNILVHVHSRPGVDLPSPPSP